MTWHTFPLGQVITEGFACLDPATDANVTADSTPTYAVFEETTDTPIVTGNFTERTGYTGVYRCQVTASSGNGFEVGKTYHLVRTLVVSGITNTVILSRFLIRAAEAVAGVIRADVSHVIGEPQQRNSTIVADYGPTA